MEVITGASAWNEIWPFTRHQKKGGFDSGCCSAENSRLLGCYAVPTGKYLSTLQINFIRILRHCTVFLNSTLSVAIPYDVSDHANEQGIDL